VMVTTPHWPATAPRLRVHRGHLAVGLHFNLTHGSPIGPMPRLAPNNTLPTRNRLLLRALAGMVDRGEIGQEVERQLDAFEKGMGFPPDHVDGHEHVHVLPGIRGPLLEAVARRYSGCKPLVRDPSDAWKAIAARGIARFKALAVAALSRQFGASARKLGVPTNQGFSGFSDFDVNQPYSQELERALIEPGPRHIVMCHPGHPDAELATTDPVVERRRMEYDALMRDVSLANRLWRPARGIDGPPVDWSRVQG
jgi:chitin disaccharide deacetylase